MLTVVYESANCCCHYLAEAVEGWRRAKLSEVKLLIHGKPANSTILPEEAGVITRSFMLFWHLNFFPLYFMQKLLKDLIIPAFVISKWFLVQF